MPDTQQKEAVVQLQVMLKDIIQDAMKQNKVDMEEGFKNFREAVGSENAEKIKKVETDFLEEVKKLRTVIKAESIVDLKEGRVLGVIAWAVVDVALQTGLRVSELAALKIGDVDFQRGCMTVTRLKRRKPFTETMAISNELCAHLREFIEWKGHVGQSVDNDAALFVGKRGPLTSRGLQQMWKACVKRAGLPSRYSIHSGRHSLAVHLLRKTKNLRLVQKALGHQSPITTANMYADVSFEDMQEGMNGLYDD